MCGYNVLLLEYRGYGKSSGTPSERGFSLDAQAALEYLLNRPDIDATKVMIGLALSIAQWQSWSFCSFQRSLFINGPAGAHFELRPSIKQCLSRCPFHWLCLNVANFHTLAL